MASGERVWCILTSSIVVGLFACADGAPAEDAEVGPLAAAAGDAGLQRPATTPRDASTAGDAATPDAARQTVNDAGTTRAAGCAGSTYKLCEDFESAAVSALPAGWTIATGWNSGTPAVTDAEHHGGLKSLRAAIATNGQPRASRSLTDLGTTAGKHWGRIFYKVKTPAPLPTQGAVIHNTLVGLKGSTEARVVDTVVNSQGKHQFLYNLPDDSCCTGSAYDYASYDGAWHCAEWYVDAATQTYRFFFEGAEVSSIGFSNGAQQRAHIEPFSAILLGWINYQTPTRPYETWFDDLAIDDRRVGCDATAR